MLGGGNVGKRAASSVAIQVNKVAKVKAHSMKSDTQAGQGVVDNADGMRCVVEVVCVCGDACERGERGKSGGGQSQ